MDVNRKNCIDNSQSPNDELQKQTPQWKQKKIQKKCLVQIIH